MSAHTWRLGWFGFHVQRECSQCGELWTELYDGPIEDEPSGPCVPKASITPKDPHHDQ